jgi:hypothetical protein
MQFAASPARFMKKLGSSPILLILLLLAAATMIAAKSPVRARMTLLSLYTKSDIVAIGRFNKKEESGTNRVNEGFTVVTTKTSFDIATVLKGESRKFVTIEDEDYQYQTQQNGIPKTAVFIDENNARKDEIKPGDTVLLFLNVGGDSVTLVDDRDGVRKISAAEQNVLTARINELNSIFEAAKVDNKQIAAWLVRCAENAATRWDGTHELLQGFRQTDWSKEKDPNGYEHFDPSVTSDHGRKAATALTDDLKGALTQILISSDFAPAGRSNMLSDGDRELIALVKRWNPTAAARYLVCQLKSGAYSAHENAGMMYKVAELVGDTRAQALWRQYLDTQRDETTADVKEKVRSQMIARFVALAENTLAQLSAAEQN